MRIRDWSSVVCSSDLPAPRHDPLDRQRRLPAFRGRRHVPDDGPGPDLPADRPARPGDPAMSLLREFRRDIALAVVALLVLLAIGFGIASPWPRDFLTSIFAVGLLAMSLNLLIGRSEEHTSELQSLMRISYAVFCLKKQ